MIDVPFIIYVVLSVPLVLFGDALRMTWGFRPDLAVIFVVALAFTGRGRLAPLFGLILGMILDSLSYESTFTYAVGFFLVGYAISYIRQHFLRRNLFVRCVSLLVLLQAFRFYLIVVGSMHAGKIVTPTFHPGILAPGLFISLLIFLPLTILLDHILPISRSEETMREVFIR
jgi:rod shape-determining protein MreD